MNSSLLFCALQLVTAIGATAKDLELLNVSYDPTRELYIDFNNSSASEWKVKAADTVIIKQSHGGSGKQARVVLDGLAAEVVTLALAGDIDPLANVGQLLSANWQKRLSHNSSPYTSTIVFLVHEGNPKKIHDRDDTVRPGVAVITPNPKTSGGARWNYLAASACAKRHHGSDAGALQFVAALDNNVPVLDSGARGSTTTFVQRYIGDVLLAWETEVFLALKEFGSDSFEIVVPTLSILAEPPVAIVDKHVDRKGTREVAQAYFEFLYSPEGQDIVGRNFHRPTAPATVEKYAKQFPQLDRVTIDQDFGGWTAAQTTDFAAGGFFDQIHAK